MKPQSVFLFKTDGRSDKVYNLHLLQEGTGWIVNYENGRRGKSLRSGTKTADPIAYEEALKIFNKVLKQKKDYTTCESGTPYAGTENAGRVTSFKPQLLNEITVEEAVELFQTRDWLIQRKHDGERRGVSFSGTEFVYSNKKGLEVGISQNIQDAVQLLSESLQGFELDAEDMGQTLQVFDVISISGESLRSTPLEDRIRYLKDLHVLTKKIGIEDVIQVDIPYEPTSTDGLLKIIEANRDAGHEGIVFKNRNAIITPGRPATGGDALKLKFWNSATVRVKSTTQGKRSISLEIQENKQWIDCGKCTIPSNYEIPDEHSLVEIKYLYAYKGGSLYQPVYKGIRTDTEVDHVTTKQLKYYTG